MIRDRSQVSHVVKKKNSPQSFRPGLTQNKPVQSQKKARSLKFQKKRDCNPSSENKGVDTTHADIRNCTASLLLCFCLGKKSFSHDAV